VRLRSGSCAHEYRDGKTSDDTGTTPDKNLCTSSVRSNSATVSTRKPVGLSRGDRRRGRPGPSPSHKVQRYEAGTRGTRRNLGPQTCWWHRAMGRPQIRRRDHSCAEAECRTSRSPDQSEEQRVDAREPKWVREEGRYHSENPVTGRATRMWPDPRTSAHHQIGCGRRVVPGGHYGSANKGHAQWAMNRECLRLPEDVRPSRAICRGEEGYDGEVAATLIVQYRTDDTRHRHSAQLLSPARDGDEYAGRSKSCRRSHTHSPEAEISRRRQARRSARQQGVISRSLPVEENDVPGGRHAGRNRAKPAGWPGEIDIVRCTRKTTELGREDRLEDRGRRRGSGRREPRRSKSGEQRRKRKSLERQGLVNLPCTCLSLPLTAV